MAYYKTKYTAAQVEQVFASVLFGYPVKSISADATLALADAGDFIIVSGSANVTITCPASSTAFPVGTEFRVWQTGTGTVTIAAASGATMSGETPYTLAAQYTSGVITKIGANAWSFIHNGVGPKGDTGVSIKSIAKTSTSGLVDTYTVTMTDNSTTTFTVTNGAQGSKGDTGNGIKSIAKTSSSGITDTYTITMDDASTATFTVTNGAKGDTGVGFSSLALISGTHAAGTSDTYRLTLTDGSTQDISVYNGANGTGAGDMTAATYDPAGGAKQVAFADELAGKLDTDGNGSSLTAAFTAAASRVNIASGETLAVILGKIMKWLADLGTAAFAATGDFAAASHNHAASAINSGTLGASYGGTGVTSIASLMALITNRTTIVSAANTSYSTYMARGESLNSAATTPTVNGTIAWQYG